MRIDGNNFPPVMNTTQTIGERPSPKGGEGQLPIQAAQVTNVDFPGEKQLIDAIEKSNVDLKVLNTNLKFSIHEKTKQISVKIINSDTKEVIKEIPPEKILDMVAAMLERTGIFMDKRG